jgi:hypothetical protein
MPFILLGLAVLVALLYGAIELFTWVDVSHGVAAASAALLACIVVLAGAVTAAWRRHRAVHGTKIGGQRRLRLDGTWGSLDVAIEDKRGTLSVDGRDLPFIFADIERAQAAQRDGKWAVLLRMRHEPTRDWRIPMHDAAAARRWARVFTLAAEQKL